MARLLQFGQQHLAGALLGPYRGLNLYGARQSCWFHHWSWGFLERVIILGRNRSLELYAVGRTTEPILTAGTPLRPGTGFNHLPAGRGKA